MEDLNLRLHLKSKSHTRPQTYAQALSCTSPRVCSDVNVAALQDVLRLVTQPRVYYNVSWMTPHDLSRVVAHNAPRDDKSALTPNEQIKARKKVVVTWSLVRSTSHFVVLLHAATCQMDQPDLEPRLFVRSGDNERVQTELERASEQGRRSTMCLLKQQGATTCYFDTSAYRACIAEDLCLILSAFESEVARVNTADALMGGAGGSRRGLLKLPAFGLGPSVALVDGTVVGPHMITSFLAALRDVLSSRPAWPFLEAIELPDFLSGAFTPRYDLSTVPVHLIVGHKTSRDVLEFTDAEAARCVCGVVSPCTVNAQPGHARARGLERVVADNTVTMAEFECFASSSSSIETIGVDTSFRNSVQWWPPRAWRVLSTPTHSSVTQTTQKKH
jgi:hypothetical protein